MLLKIPDTQTAKSSQRLGFGGYLFITSHLEKLSYLLSYFALFTKLEQHQNQCSSYNGHSNCQQNFKCPACPPSLLDKTTNKTSDANNRNELLLPIFQFIA